MTFREPKAQLTHILHGTETRCLCLAKKFKSPSPVLPKPIKLVYGKRIHLWGKNGQYILAGSDAGGNLFITTKEWMRDGYCKMVRKSDFKCYAGGYNAPVIVPRNLRLV